MSSKLTQYMWGQLEIICNFWKMFYSCWALKKKNAFKSICYVIKEWFFVLIIFRKLYFIIQFGAVWCSCGKDMTITICHNKPQRGNEAGVWIMSCQKRWSWEFEDFEKTSVEILLLRFVVGYLTVKRCSWVFYRWSMWLSFSDIDQQRWIEMHCALRWS